MIKILQKIQKYAAYILLVSLPGILLFPLILRSAGNPVNNTPASAYVQHLAIDPVRQDTLYAAAMGAGLYKSSDGAASWTDISPDTGTKAWYVVAVDPDHPHRIFAGGDGSGLWLSGDGGQPGNRSGPAKRPSAIWLLIRPIRIASLS